jgi:integrase
MRARILHALIVAALETGCRLGELLSLQWGAVEYMDQKTKAGKVERVPRYFLLTASKTKTGVSRRVPVTARTRRSARNALRRPQGKTFPTRPPMSSGMKLASL